MQRRSPDRRGRLRLLGPGVMPAPNRSHSGRVTVDGTAALVDRHAVWHHFHSICQEGQSAMTCRTVHSVTAMSFCMQHSHGRTVSPYGLPFAPAMFRHQ